MIEAIAGVNALKRCKGELGANANLDDDDKRSLEELNDSDDDDVLTEFVPLMVANEVDFAWTATFKGHHISLTCCVRLCCYVFWSCRNTTRSGRTCAQRPVSVSSTLICPRRCGMIRLRVVGIQSYKCCVLGFRWSWPKWQSCCSATEVL